MPTNMYKNLHVFASKSPDNSTVFRSGIVQAEGKINIKIVFQDLSDQKNEVTQIITFLLKYGGRNELVQD